MRSVSGHHLLIELGLAGLLDAGVQIADVGHQAQHGFAVDLEHQAQNTVGRRMLRTHVEDHGAIFGTLFRPGFDERRDGEIGGIRHQRYPSTG